MEILSNKAPADPAYDYEKAYDKYYEDDEDVKDDEEDFYGDGNDSQVAGGSSQGNYPNDHPTTLPLSPAVPNI